MARKFAILQRIERDHKITNETDYAFLYCLQKGLLLALKEQGRLNDMQYRCAEERLMAQWRNCAKKRLQKRGTDQ